MLALTPAASLIAAAVAWLVVLSPGTALARTAASAPTRQVEGIVQRRRRRDRPGRGWRPAGFPDGAGKRHLASDRLGGGGSGREHRRRRLWSRDRRGGPGGW